MTASGSQNANAQDQYSLAKILGLWAAATLPMAILSWSVFFAFLNLGVGLGLA